MQKRKTMMQRVKAIREKIHKLHTKRESYLQSEVNYGQAGVVQEWMSPLEINWVTVSDCNLI